MPTPVRSVWARLQGWYYRNRRWEAWYERGYRDGFRQTAFAHVDWLHEGQQVAYREGHRHGAWARQHGVTYTEGLPVWARRTMRPPTDASAQQ